MATDNIKTSNDFMTGIGGRTISYVIFILWTAITILPLVWMFYSSFKSNEELTRNIFAPPKELFTNMDDEYTVIPMSVSVIPPYDPDIDTRERLIIESKTISPGRRLFVHFLLKEKLPPEIANRKIGDTVIVRELPWSMRQAINWKTVWFNYTSAFQRGKLGGKFINSILYSGVSTFLVVIFGLMMAFAISKLAFKKLSAVAMGLVGLGYLISTNSVLIPLFLMLSKIGLTDTHLGIILVYVAFGLPLAVLLATQFMQGLPNSLVESANIDGATTFQAFTYIILPMCVPVIITISIMTALGIWNEFLLVLVLASSDFTKSLPVGVFSFSSLTSTQLGWQIAALVIATIPAMAVYFAFNQSITKGVVAGAVKG
ncbi:carbohydrate ABC transporter permease [Spirochaeta cellobiosiphila]|uniref:carbohydrate ABC transporter permease n=1 Tax=Spirochaeta cellobiosiphila TaxID=504483 RepID=UPI0003FB25E5|nr:carbohydrate ABC transporter permease [Spirochaeta cellobiosiphila]